MSAPILDTKAFADWIGKQRPNTRYEYTTPFYCLIAQYLRHKGVQFWAVGPYDIALNQNHIGNIVIPPEWRYIARGNNFDAAEYTFGAAHTRALEVLSKEAA